MKNNILHFAAGVSARCIDLLFPRRCPVCGDIVDFSGILICPECMEKLSPVKNPICKKCGKELISDQQEYCFDCTRHPKSFDAGRALLNYNEAAQHSVAAVKYKNRREYLDFYAGAMARRFWETVSRWQPQMLVPVPVHPSRRRSRGFNQAEELAKHLSDAWGIPMETRMLLRMRKTRPQHDLGPAERLKNLQQAFAVHPQRIADAGCPETVLLIDDIYTTGSTIEACTRVLKAAGVQKVYFLTICIGCGR